MRAKTWTLVAPFKVFDNLYYVGVGYVGSWLIRRPASVRRA